MEIIIATVSICLCAMACIAKHYRHNERMKDKDLKGVKLHNEYKEDHIGNAYVVEQLAKILNIEDWKWSHKHEACRAQIISNVKNLMDAVGEN